MAPPLTDDEFVVAYHERTKHHYHRTAASLGYLDWDSQPDPFRRFAGAELHELPLELLPLTLRFDDLYRPQAVAAEPLSRAAIARFFRLSLSLTAWKSAGGARWALRANPSSGNLHPTEAYAVLPAIVGLADKPAIYHYAPREHALELRVTLNSAAGAWPLPEGAFIVGLTSIPWREAWKYGERAFRYCQHDLGHALGALRYAAAVNGWRLALLDDVSDATIATVLGVDRVADFAGAERELPECLVLVRSGAPPTTPNIDLLAGLVRTAPDALWQGRANVLSREHVIDWDIIDAVADRTRKTAGGGIAAGRWDDFPNEPQLFASPPSARPRLAEAVILGRRSAVAMDGHTAITRETFFHMMARLVPQPGHRAMPIDVIPWRPHVHLGVFVHRVTGIDPGLYALVRDPAQLALLRGAMSPDFAWRQPEHCPSGLDLHQLKLGNYQKIATSVSCTQEIAGDGAFSLGMFAQLSDGLIAHGAAFYRRLFWETGLIGQVLYLEAEAAGVRATGIGCYFDDPVASVFGLKGVAIQSLYHFTVGGAVDDRRLTTLPAYPERSSRAGAPVRT